MAKRYGGWDNPPPVLVLSGSEGFLRRRELQKGLRAAGFTKRSVDYVDGSDSGALLDALDGGLLAMGPTLLVVSNPNAVSLPVIQGHLEADDNTICILLVHEEKVRKGSNLEKISALLPEKSRLTHNPPEKAHLAKDRAVAFVVREAQARGKRISGDLAEALVDKVGLDLGILYFEVLKVSTYMDYHSIGEIVQPAHLKATMMMAGSSNVSAVSDALGRGHILKVLRALEGLSGGLEEEEGGRTLMVVAWLSSQATKWLHAACLLDMGAEEAEAASRMSIHPYVYKQFLVPPARVWGQKNLIRLLKRLVKVEAAVKKSHLSPWRELEAALITACKGL